MELYKLPELYLFLGFLAVLLFGTGKGSGAAALFLLLGALGVITCLIFRRDPYIRALEDPPRRTHTV